MKSLIFTAILALLSTAAGAAFNPHARAAKYKQAVQPHRPFAKKGHGWPPSSLTNKTALFAVNGSNIPNVAFDIGESYAGTLPVSNNTNDGNRLYFWYFPSENPEAGDEITIWLNGGPGCSSLDGLLQENGPFLWQSGTYSPIQNPYSWTNLTNMVYVDQPVGTGFSPATNGTAASIVNEEIVAKDFMAFWKNFMETFDLRGRKVYITGESYAGQYIPYIAYYMLEANDTKYYNVKGVQINDPSINEESVIMEAPAVMALNYYNNIIGLNETFMTAINQLADECGFTDFMEQALQFPPLEQFPTLNMNWSTCDVYDAIITAAYYVNPCFNIYHLTDFCPYLWDEMGFPSLGWGPNDYFNQTNVQQAINAPPTDYSVCGNADLGLNEGDGSVPSALGPLPYVIERTNNVVIGHGMLDFLLFANGSLATIQNMTWNGMQGFQQRPEGKFFVPYHNYLAQETSATDIAGAGYLGITHTERGLTFVMVDHSGHEIPQYVPGAAYRQLEFLLGRISSLTDLGDYTTDPGNYTGTSPLRR